MPPIAPRLKAKMAFITDGRAISYAESYLAIIEAYKLAEIVGETTAGTNGNVNPMSSTRKLSSGLDRNESAQARRFATSWRRHQTDCSCVAHNPRRSGRAG